MKSFPASLLALMICLNSFAQPLTLRGKVDEVTVYRGQALVSRVVDLPDKTGVLELLVSELPPRILPGSLFAEGDESLQVRSVLYRTRATADDVREDVRKLDAQLAALNDSIVETQRDIEVLNQNGQTLGKLEQFTATVASSDLARGVLDADTLQKLTQFIFEQRSSLNKQKITAERNIGKLQADVELQQRKRGELTAGASRTAREAVVLVDARKPNAKLRLSYLVDQATWEPSYTIQAKRGESSVNVNYQAAISQLTGEDWGDVKMSLSTATPSVVSRAPTLEPLELTLARLDQQTAKGESRSPSEVARELNDRKVQIGNVLNYNGTLNAPAQQQAEPGGFVGVQRDNIYAARQIVDEQQTFEFSAKDKESIRAVNRPDQAVTVSYQLATRTTLSSRSDRQLIGIASLAMKGDFYRLATPVLSSYVYREASIINSSATVLLDGPSMSYLDGEFVGHGVLPMTAVGAGFVAGFGIDPSLRTTRELIERTEQTQGGNMIITFDYRVNIENFGEEPTSVRLIDRIPKPNGNQLKPTLVSTSQPLSADEEYERTQKKLGLLRWDAQVPARSSGGKAVAIDYRLTLEHDRNLTVAGLGAR